MGAGIRPLAVEFRRIEGDGKVNLQQTPVADLAGVECDANGFRVSRPAGTNDPVFCRLFITPGVPRHGVRHARDVLENALNTPKASTGEHRCFEAGFLTRRLVEGGKRHDARIIG